MAVIVTVVLPAVVGAAVQAVIVIKISQISQANSCTSDAKEHSSGMSRCSSAALHSLLHVLWRPLAAASSLQSPRRVVTSCLTASCRHVLPHRVVLSRPASPRRVVTSCLTASCCRVLPHCVLLSRPASLRPVVTSCLTASCFVAIGYGWLRS